MRPLRTRYPGECLRCGRPIGVGEDVLYDDATKRLLCDTCGTTAGPELEEPTGAGVT